MIIKVLQQAKQKQQQQQQKHQLQQIIVDAARKNHFSLLPYKGEKGHLIKSMKRRISKLLF